MRYGQGCSKRWLWMLFALPLLHGGPAYGQSAPSFDNPAGIPDIREVVPPASDSEGVSSSLQILVLLTVLTLVPSILIMMTASSSCWRYCDRLWVRSNSRPGRSCSDSRSF